MAEPTISLKPFRGQDLTGGKFGRLTVIEFVGYHQHRTSKTPCWKCICSCGTERVVMSNALKQGLTTSCGCVRKEVHTTHGRHGVGIYTTWASMKNRCLNPDNAHFHNYGGRGIKVDPKWLEFGGFFEDMGATWNKGLTIERLDVNGNYDKSNCVWATRQVQNSNTRRTVWIERNGERKTLTDWSRITGIKMCVLTARRFRGWSDADLFLPIRSRSQV